jgi:hypothetical protein
MTDSEIVTHLQKLAASASERAFAPVGIPTVGREILLADRRSLLRMADAIAVATDPFDAFFDNPLLSDRLRRQTAQLVMACQAHRHAIATLRRSTFELRI